MRMAEAPLVSVEALRELRVLLALSAAAQKPAGDEVLSALERGLFAFVYCAAHEGARVGELSECSCPPK
jgi:hypothetical protein